MADLVQEYEKKPSPVGPNTENSSRSRKKNEGHVLEKRNNKREPYERVRAQKWQLDLKRMVVREDFYGRARVCGKVGKSMREKGNTN